MILNNNILLSQVVIGPPPPPPLFDTMTFSALVPPTSYGNVSTRQTALEPSVAGADVPFSVAIWIAPHNVCNGLNTQRICGVGETGASLLQQWSLSITPQSTSTNNQRLQFAIYGTGATTFIYIIGSERFLRGRWTHVVVTYDGSESHTGLKLYINGVEDTGATKATTGSYVGAANDTDFRFILSSVFSADRRYTGRMTFLDLWNDDLSQAEVTERYALGVPVISTGMSFIAKLIARWNLQTDVVCQNNGSYSITVGALIVTSQIAISAHYPYMSIFNAIPANTRYVSFGSMIETNDDEWFIYQRSGTTHSLNGKITKSVFTRSGDDYSVSSQVDCIVDATYDLRNAAAGIIDGNVVIFTTRDAGVSTWIDIKYYTSTDGLVGETFDSGVAVDGLLPAHANGMLTMDRIIDGPAAGEKMVCLYGIDGATYWIGYLKRSTGGVWSYVSIYSGATAYGETVLLNCGSGVFIGLVRRNAGGLYMVKSTDGAGAVWSAPADTGLATGVSMASMTLSVTGKIVACFVDRADSSVYVSADNIVADVLADATDWVAKSKIFQNYPGASISILGYPVILTHGYMGTICFSAEFSSARADLFLGYGQIQY